MSSKMRFSIIATSAVMIFIAIPLSANAGNGLEVISLERAIAIARGNNPDYLIAVEKQRAASEKVKEVWGALYPAIESEVSMARHGAETGILSLTDGQYDIKIVQVRFGINPGIFYNSLQMSRKAYRIATEEVRKIKSEIEYNVIQSYFSLLLAEEVITMQKEAIELFKENLKDVANLFKTGSVPRYELLQAQVKLKSIEPALLESENRSRVALEMFNYHLGSDSKRYTVDRSILKRDRYRIAEASIDDFTIRVGGIALKNRPELIQLKIKREIEQHNKKANSSYYLWPTFAVGGYYGYNKSLPVSKTSTAITPAGPVNIDLSQITGDGRWQPNWQVWMAATYRWGSLLPVDSAHARRREADAKVRQADEELKKIQRLVTISIKASYSNLLTAYYTIISHRENVSKAAEGLRIARESYRAGVIKNSELFAAHLALTEAKTGYINAVNSYYTSYAQLRKEIGVDDDAIIFGGDHE